MRKEVILILFLSMFLVSACAIDEYANNRRNSGNDIEETGCGVECNFGGRACIGNSVYTCTIKEDGCKRETLAEACNGICSNGQCGESNNTIECGDGKCINDETCGSCFKDCGTCILEEDDSEKIGLDMYPYPFINRSSFNNLKIAIGDDGSYAETLALTTIMLKLQSYTNDSAPTPQLAGEIEDLEGYNIILIGNPCTNKLIAQYEKKAYGQSPECDNYLNSGEARIKLKKSGGDYVLLVIAKDDIDFRRAGVVLQNYDEFNLRFDEVRVRGSSLLLKDIDVF